MSRGKYNVQACTETEQKRDSSFWLCVGSLLIFTCVCVLIVGITWIVNRNDSTTDTYEDSKFERLYEIAENQNITMNQNNSNINSTMLFTTKSPEQTKNSSHSQKPHISDQDVSPEFNPDSFEQNQLDENYSESSVSINDTQTMSMIPNADNKTNVLNNDHASTTPQNKNINFEDELSHVNSIKNILNNTNE